MALANYQRFGKEHFSGSDVYIFFNNTLVDKIVSIQFEMSQAMNFIFGYASYTTDAVAYGNRLVVGSLRVNFTESMYLYTISGLMGYDPYNSDTIQDALETKKPWVNGDLSADQIATMIKNGKQEKMIDIMNLCESRIWGPDTGGTKINKYRTPFFTSNVGNNPVGFNMKEKGFDIVISYGDKEFPIGMNKDKLPSTVKVINGVFLTGVKQVIEPTGDNIFEEYSFMARDLDNTIGQTK